jgi:hypothetical protein
MSEGWEKVSSTVINRLKELLQEKENELARPLHDLWRGFEKGVEELIKLKKSLEQEFERLKGLVSPGFSLIVPISNFEPEPYEAIKEIQVVVQPDSDSFIASFFDANINASAETQQDAVSNLKDLMIALYERLGREPNEKLGKGPARQLAILRSVMRRKAIYASHQ